MTTFREMKLKIYLHLSYVRNLFLNLSIIISYCALVKLVCSVREVANICVYNNVRNIKKISNENLCIKLPNIWLQYKIEK